ncbi:MAG: orotidine-5'-phosphate decarboxylase [Desulfosarcinaceae bacterium]
MNQAKDRIIFPLDVSSGQEARHWVDRLKDHVGMFKVGLELFIRCGPDLVDWITRTSGARVFLDLKLHDIPETVRRAMQSVSALNVDLVTVHCGESPAMLEAAVKGAAGRVRVLGVTVLTSVSAGDLRSAGCLDAGQGVTELVLRRADMARSAGCAGVVCSGREVREIKTRLGSAFLAVTPGIRPGWGEKAEDDQRRVVTPAMAVAAGADYLVIGRPIREAADPVGTVARIAREVEEAPGRQG